VSRNGDAVDRPAGFAAPAAAESAGA